ncbi:hypothetical protein PMIN05_008390 [Paraphaeosphaeria minitans]
MFLHRSSQISLTKCYSVAQDSEHPLPNTTTRYQKGAPGYVEKKYLDYLNYALECWQAANYSQVYIRLLYHIDSNASYLFDAKISRMKFDNLRMDSSKLDS